MEREKKRERLSEIEGASGRRDGDEGVKKNTRGAFIPRGNGQFCYRTSNFVPIDTRT